ncbi:MAG: hypothetical protein KKD31_12005, partial [Bacteroidetes bacterium]|nr:hypothetical protein [Bacteroidota bacterium]
FQCTDPDINWDGANQNTKIECSDGVYYYVCDVYEMRLNGLTKRTIADIIYIIRGPTTWYK